MKRRFEGDDCTKRIEKCAEKSTAKSTKNDLIKDTPRRCGLKALARKYELIHKADHALENELDISLPGFRLEKNSYADWTRNPRTRFDQPVIRWIRIENHKILDQLGPSGARIPAHDGRKNRPDIDPMT